MKAFTIFFISILTGIASFANDTIPVQSKIKEVTVFLKGAQITRTAYATIPKGNKLIKFKGLSANIQSQSIQASGSNKLTILSVSFKKNFLDKHKIEKETETLKNERHKLKNIITELRADYSVLEQEEFVITKNSFSLGQQKKITAQDLEKASELYKKRLMEIRMKQYKIYETKDSLNKRIKNISKQLRVLNYKKENPTGEIVVSVNSNSTLKTKLKISYAVSSAGWFPKYNVRVKNITKPLNLTLNAKIYQSTGVKWDNVKLTVSNGDLKKKGIRPILKTWFLDFYRYQRYSYDSRTYNRPGTAGSRTVVGKVTDESGYPLPGVSIIRSGTTKGTMTDIDGNYSIDVNDNETLVFSFVGLKTQRINVGNNNVVNCAMYSNGQELEEVVVTATGVSRDKKKLGYDSSTIEMEDSEKSMFGNKRSYKRRSRRAKRGLKGKVRGVSAKKEIIAQKNEVKKKETSVEYVLEKPYTIPSDNKIHGVDVKTYKISADYKYATVPLMDNSVFLTAQIKDRSNYDLLSAKSDLFFEGTYIGEANIDATVADSVLNFSLGRDNNVYIKRKKLIDFTDKQFIGNKKIETFAYEISIRNKKNAELEVKIEDRIPISSTNKIVVKPIELSGAKHVKDTGILTWNLKLKPRETKKIIIKYSVKYPKDKFVNLER